MDNALIHYFNFRSCIEKLIIFIREVQGVRLVNLVVVFRNWAYLVHF